MNADGVREHETPRVSGTNPVGFRRGEKLNSKDVVEYNGRSELPTKTHNSVNGHDIFYIPTRYFSFQLV
ncbi:MAG: hypothetical protein ACRCUY_05070 [Thermoguttaceae bacterium]